MSTQVSGEETYRVPAGREVAEVRIAAYEVRPGKERWQFDFFNRAGRQLVHQSGCLSFADACEDATKFKAQVEKGVVIL